MATTITAGNATNGAAISSDNTGILELKTGTGSGTTALTLSTGQQVAYALGTAAAPSITFSGDTNTGIFSPTADTIAFTEGGAEVARFDSSGALLIGRTTTLLNNSTGTLIQPLTTTIASNSNGTLRLGNYSPTVSADIGGLLRFDAVYRNSDGDSTDIAGIAGLRENATNSNYAGYLSFSTTPNGGSRTERARITSTGNFAIGTTLTANYGNIGLYVSGNGGGYTAVSIGASGGDYGVIGYNTGFTSTAGTYKAIASDGMSWIRFLNGSFEFWRQASATAGTNYTGTQGMTLDANGRLGIGTTSPGTPLHVLGTSSEVARFIRDNTGGASGGVTIGNNSRVFTIYGDSSALSFWDTTAAAERARIDSTGAFIGRTYIKADTYLWAAGSGANGLYLANGSANGLISQQSNGGGTTTTYIGNQSITTSSDIRLKENVSPTERNALELLQQWEIVDHTWNDPSDQAENNRNSRGVWTGVVAQQVQPITPWLVNKPLEEINEDGSINPWTMDFGYAVPLLVKAIQELKAELDATKAEVAALKGAAQ